MITYHYYQFNNNRIVEIKNNPNESMVFSSYCPENKIDKNWQLLVWETFGDDATSWENTSYAEYYSAKSVSRVECK